MREKELQDAFCIMTDRLSLRDEHDSGTNMSL